MSDGNLERRIAEIEAREAVRELRARYGWHAARGQAAEIAALFAPDGIFEFSTREARHRLVGRAAIAAALARHMSPLAVIPLLHNHTVTVKGDEAWGTCAMETRVAPAYPGGFAGYYHDWARKLEEGWRFTERRWFLYSPVFEDSGLDLDGEPRRAAL